MERTRRRLVGAYPLTGTATDDAGQVVTLTSPATVTVIGPDGTTLVDEAAASVVAGVLGYQLPVAIADGLGHHIALWSADGQQWETHFEIVTPSYFDTFNDVKLALRISADAYDEEIASIIDAAKADLRIAGISESVLEATYVDALVKRYIVTYAKAHFGLDNPDSEKYLQSCLSLKQHLCLSAEYRPAEVSS